MTREEREQMSWLWLMIQEERDSEVFGKLVDELTDMLERERERLRSKARTRPN